MTSLPPLATTLDAAEYGLTVTDEALIRASARVRGHLRQRITVGTSTVILPESYRRLPERPVVSVESVKDADGVTLTYWELIGDRIVTTVRGPLTVAYTHGLDVLPDELIELVCSVAARLGALPADLVAGVQSAGTAGPFSGPTYGWDSYKAAAGLTEGEKKVLARLWPSPGRTITLASPA